MKIIMKSYKLELKPNKQQKILLDKHFGCNRFIYNYFLNQRKDEYNKGNKNLNYYKQAEYLTQLKKARRI
jgi:putative transposase